MSTLSIDCRRCGNTVEVDESQPLPAAFPFCSDRCRLIDLGKWFDEEYTTSREIRDADLDQGE